MLINSFIHISGILAGRERRLWKQGILTWDNFVENLDKLKLSDCCKQNGLKTIAESKDCLRNAEHKYFIRMLPPSEAWRLYQEFKDSAAYVDIETSGLSTGGDSITMIGVYDGTEQKTFVRGENLLAAEEEIFKYKLLVTYNGTSFDLPTIFGLFPRLKDKHLHFDVMYPLRRLGYKGGLKGVEKTLGIQRSKDVENFTGWDAVKLWQAYIVNDDKKALELLTTYNREDCKNLKPLAEFAYKNLKKQIFERYAGAYIK